MPPEGCWVECYGFPEYNLIYYVAALARAVDTEYRLRTEAAMAAFNRGQEAGAGGADGAGGAAARLKGKLTPAGTKSWGRMKAKLMGDHSFLATPRPGNNVDCCRAGLECDVRDVVGLFGFMSAEFGRNGGGVVRVKNGFAMTEEQVRVANGYQVVLVNYRMVCETVTYADVIPHLEAICQEATGGRKAEDDREFSPILRWLQSASVRDEAVTFVVETQTIIPVMLASRQLSHYPYKFVRCAGDGDTSPEAMLDGLVSDLR
jgi:hypothetical protein